MSSEIAYIRGFYTLHNVLKLLVQASHFVNTPRNGHFRLQNKLTMGQLL